MYIFVVDIINTLISNWKRLQAFGACVILSSSNRKLSTSSLRKQLRRDRFKSTATREWTGLEFGSPWGQWRTGKNGENWWQSSVVPQRPSRLRDWCWWCNIPYLETEPSNDYFCCFITEQFKSKTMDQVIAQIALGLFDSITTIRLQPVTLFGCVVWSI